MYYSVSKVDGNVIYTPETLAKNINHNTGNYRRAVEGMEEFCSLVSGDFKLLQLCLGKCLSNVPSLMV